MEKKYHCLEDFSVRFVETDAAGLVHFTNFLRWAENAESDFFRTYGAAMMKKDAAGTLCGFPRVAVNINYRTPARYADLIRVRIRPESHPEATSRSLSWEFRISRVEKDNAEALLAHGTWKTVFAKIDINGNVEAGTVLPEDIFYAVKNFFEKN